MHKNRSVEFTTTPVPMSRRQLLAGVAATGTLLVTGSGTAAVPHASPVRDPQLREALRRYGGEFGQLGSDTGDEHGHL